MNPFGKALEQIRLATNWNAGYLPGVPHCFSVWLAGGGVKGGFTYGESDEIGWFRLFGY